MQTKKIVLSNKQKGLYFGLLYKNFQKHRVAYIMIIPVILYYIIFHYIPMFGVLIAFKEYSPHLGVFKSPWVGFDHFVSFITDRYFGRIFLNTLTISCKNILIGFPLPIIFSLLINEVSNIKFKKAIQTVTYLPHFVSLVVICGLLVSFLGVDGIFNDIIEMLGGERIAFLQEGKYFSNIYVWSGVWQELGWSSIIYISALSAIDTQLYEACALDGGGRFRQAIHVTLPGLSTTIIILFIMRLGAALSIGFEKIILLYNEMIYDKADVISTYVYRKGLLDSNWSYSTAVSLFNSVINIVLLIGSNAISRKINDISLW